LFAEQEITRDDFINANLPKANTFGLDIFMEGTMSASIPHSFYLAAFGEKRQAKCDLEVLQVLNCILHPNFFSVT